MTDERTDGQRGIYSVVGIETENDAGQNITVNGYRYRALIITIEINRNSCMFVSYAIPNQTVWHRDRMSQASFKNLK